MLLPMGGSPGAGDGMNYIHSFPPISNRRARVLVLGSMPGKVSLREAQYYAHPRNLFWRFMEEVLDIPREAPYATRCSLLRENGVALWDTLKTCARASSLDSDIDDATLVPNDFSSFLELHPQVRMICFNGAKSESIFRQRVAPTLGRTLDGIELKRLPSTSPANASVPLEVKLGQWRAIAMWLKRETG
jgi:TDG/mug DNA glycosylase family protein